ncbi:MAG: polyprenyl diphosphate synthase [Candidatus Woesearchaeota archaeon]
MGNVSHIAIILDGNRRFAKRLMLEPWKGHEYGAKKVEALIDWCYELGIFELTIYSFSMQNFNRPKQEFDYLMKIMREAFEKFKDDPKVDQYGIKVNILGRYQLFPPDVVEIFDTVMKKTAHNNKFIINFAMAYGGREELLDAIKAIAQETANGKLDPQTIDEHTIRSHLYTASEPEIIIRTGGEKRLSNFLPWQSVYSELFFVDKAWPEFEKEDLLAVLEEFSRRERRFGK